MKLSEIFSQLTFGELSQISLGGGEAGEIKEDNYESVLVHVNLGLTALYKRFPLKEGRILVALQANRYTYALTRAYAESNTRSLELVKYIQDAGNPFMDDIHKIERVYSSTGKEFGLNDEADPYAISTPSASVLRVPASVVAQSGDLPDGLKTSTLEVVYRANHPIIRQSDVGFDPLTYDVELPYTHLEPLLLFVASRVNNPIGMVNEFNAGNNYAAKYEKACQDLETMNLRVDQGAQHDRIRRNGWV